MEKKTTALKIVHLILIVAGIVLYAITLVNHTADSSAYGTSALSSITPLAHMAALIAGFFYLILGYKKNAAFYYNLFLWLLVISQVIKAAYLMNVGAVAVYSSLMESIITVLFVVLAVVKDFGKKNTNIAAIALLALQAILVLLAIIQYPANGTAASRILFDHIGELILALVTILMVRAKYLDKAQRGRE